jgi:ubiquinol-cytochrome c reductase cytochrome c subunit
MFGVLVLLLAAAGAVAGATSGGSSNADAQPANAVTEASAGEGLFLTSCAACHGPQGAGTSVGPDIRQAGAALADFVLRTGRMPLADPANPDQRGAPLFSDVEIQALVAYVASLGNGPAIPNVVTSGADTARGRDLFVANCAACHGPAGGGGAVGGGFIAPPLVGDDATTVGEAAITGPGPMPRFSFAPEDLNDLAAYVEYLRDAPHPGGATGPAVGPVTEGFIAGLVLLGLLLVARWVAVRRDRNVADEPATSGSVE